MGLKGLMGEYGQMPCFSPFSVVFLILFQFDFILSENRAQLVYSPWHNICLRVFAVFFFKSQFNREKLGG